MSTGTYKQNVTTTMMLAILPSFVRKSHPQGPARLKTSLLVLEASPFMSIDHYIYHLHRALSQTSNTNHLLRNWSSILKPQINFFTNRAYFSTYEEYHHEFQTGSGKILTAHGYRDVVLRLANPDGSEVTWTIKKVSLAPSLGHNLLSTILLARKGVEVFIRQPHIPSEISHQRFLFGLADIIDNQYVVRTTGYFLISTSDQEIINAMTPISIQTWHCQMGHLGYQSILPLPKIADEIDVKGPIPGEICGDCMKGRQPRKPSYKPMSHPTEYLDYLYFDLGGPYPTTQRGNQFYPGIRDGATGACYTEPLRTKGQAFDTF